MLLIFDIGNTNVKVALFESKVITTLAAIPQNTGDEYFMLINACLKITIWILNRLPALS